VRGEYKGTKDLAMKRGVEVRREDSQKKKKMCKREEGIIFFFFFCFCFCFLTSMSLPYFSTFQKYEVRTGT
jgi:hypothetical protein